MPPSVRAVASSETPPPALTPSPNQELPEELKPFAQLIQQRKTGPARIRLRRHLDAHPDDARAEFLFGLSYHREKKYAAACEHMDRARELEPGYLLAHYFAGWAHYYLGELVEARRAFDTHLALAPEEPDTRFGLGLVEIEDGDLDAAERRFREAIDMQGGENADRRELSKSWARLADVHLLRNEFVEARDALNTSIALYPDQYEALFKLYRVLIRLGEDQRAEEVFAIYQSVKQRIRPDDAGSRQRVNR
jgi:tetratricopeptide (TPR) repeat protein